MYAAGTYTNSATFGAVAVSSATAFGGRNAYVAKLLDNGSAGAFSWVKPIFAGFGSANAQALAVTGSSVLVGGYVQHAATFGPLAINSSSVDIFGFLATLTDATLSNGLASSLRRMCRRIFTSGRANRWGRITLPSCLTASPLKTQFRLPTRAKYFRRIQRLPFRGCRRPAHFQSARNSSASTR